MGVQELMLLAMLLFSFCSPASFSPVNTHENMRDHKPIDKNDSIIGGGGGSRMVNESKYTTAVRAARGGGRAGAGGSGGALIPVYAGGTAGQNRIHKGAAPCREGGFPVLIATSAYLLLHICKN
ncbi:uncharacterized protein LOC111914663 [Lactuca sativa]|uniref:Uncharacterized protein n=1 Tax=Lactuca sativa TaxID=4236 RepID=A0A9R1UCW7_LACSA|nr:uncharacterized protein LOC111914663 [Lactuca sativa]KAJ0184833.1 hypothetical protein LSAT_V11C900474510 [Lactuca sativa]